MTWGAPHRRLAGPGPRFFPGQRWVAIGLRTAHLIGVAGMGAAFLYPPAGDAWRDYLHLALWSGLSLSLVFTWSYPAWLLEVRGQAILVKICLLGAIPWVPGLKTPLFLGVLVISGVFSHAPGRVRHYSPFRHSPERP